MERATPKLGLSHGVFTDRFIFRYILEQFFPRKWKLLSVYEHIQKIGYEKRKLNVIKRSKISFSGQVADWLVGLKLKMLQIRAKNVKKINWSVKTTQVHGCGLLRIIIMVCCCCCRNSVAEGHLYLSPSDPSFHPRFPEGLTEDVAKVALKTGRKIVRPLKQSHGAFRHNLDPISSATRRLRLIGSRSNHVQMHNAFLNNAFLQFLLYNNQESCSCNNLGVIFFTTEQSSNDSVAFPLSPFFCLKQYFNFWTSLRTFQIAAENAVYAVIF